MSSAYAAYWLIEREGCPVLIGLFAGLGIAAILGVLCEKLLYAPLLRGRSSQLILMLSSLGLYIVIINVISLLFGGDTQVFTFVHNKTFKLRICYITKLQLAQSATCLAIVFATIILLRITRSGQLIRMVRDNPILASVLGVKIPLVRAWVFAAGSTLAAVAALFSAADVGIDPNIGMPALLIAAVSLIIGGVGSFEGAALGGFVIGLLQSIVVWKFSSEWIDTATYLLLILFLLFRPQGIVGFRHRIEETVN